MADKKKVRGHPKFKAAVSHLVYAMRQELKADDLDALASIGEQLGKVVREEKAYRNRETPVIDRLGSGHGKASR